LKVMKALTAVLIVLAIGLAAFWLYVQVRTYPAEAEYLELIMTDQRITFGDEGNYFMIAPAKRRPAMPPIIYYPGGLVAPEAYLYKMGMVAIELGAEVYIIKAPFNAAIFNSGAAGKIMESRDLSQAWVGGHSLGGIAACRFASSNSENIYGLFLFGSYCDQDISNTGKPVVVLWGRQDFIINRENFEKAKANLPSGSTILEIEGMNHSDFGNYGLQKGDRPSQLSDRQIIEIISAAFTGYEEAAP
jgi:pimeloyl-ACP methyl ester carboxylesterase